MQINKSIAVLLTCFNRIEHTKKCIEKIYSKKIDIYLVDDGSTDGTFEYIRENYPKVNLIKGDGSLFWNRGMYKAWEHASKKSYDYFIWMNDDIKPTDDAFEEIIECSLINKDECIISGIIQSEKGEIIYGGSNEKKKLIKPNGNFQQIRFLNGNFVLVPKHVFKILGNLDFNLHHDLGDVDYGLRAITKNIKVLTTRKAVAIGTVNNICRIRKNKTSVKKRFKQLNSPLGSPLKIVYYFQKKHFGYLKAILTVSFLVFLNLIPDNLNKALFKNKYI